jgi:tetratricopeptide (TPR) repeat protein
LANAHDTLGLILKDMNRPADAVAESRAGVAIRERLAAADPNNAALRNSLGGNLHNLAEACADLGQHAEALTLLDRAVAHQEAALKLNPKMPAIRRYLRNHHGLRAMIRARLGEYDAAAESLRAMRAASPETADDLADAARFALGCAEAADGVTGPPTEARAARVAAFTEVAVGFLREAVEKGFRDVQALRTEDSFQSLRARPDFQELLAGLTARAK